MKIIIETIPHKDHRYPTVGDWYYKNKTLHIKVSEMEDPRYAKLVAVHELIEVLICEHTGVTQKMVDDFDFDFEKRRKKKLVGATAEPGDDPNAPYVNEHCVATSVERLLCALLGVNWKQYEDYLNNLP